MGTIYFCTFLTLPIFATYSVMRTKGMVRATVLTMVSVFLPFLFATSAIAVVEIDGPEESLIPMTLIFLFSYGAFASVACFLLRHSLSRRLYAF